MKNALLITFGCKTNQYESDTLRRDLAALGYRADGSGPPEIAVVNTCTVTLRADRKCRQWIARIAREHPGVPVYVTGCYAIRKADELAKLEGVAEVCANKDELLELLARKEHEAPPTVRHAKFVPGMRRVRALLKIQDGCDQFCSYCIVPYVRPTLHSEPIDAVAREARELVEAGFREIVLAGIHLGRYGADRTDGVTLVDVIRRVAATPGLARLRLSALENPEVADDLLELMATNAVICPHLHLPLQSGDDKVLTAMNRRYTAAGYLETIRRIRARVPDISITTDVIVAFPGESDEAFENTLAVCREAKFSKIHVFPFSERPGTKATGMLNTLPARVVTRRKKRLVALGEELGVEYRRQFVGQTVQVLVEADEVEPGSHRFASGLTRHDLRVRFPSQADYVNQTVPVVVESVLPELMQGRRFG